MAGEEFGANVITIAEQPMLLTETSGGTVVHLTRAEHPDRGARAAVHEHYLGEANLRRVPSAGRYRRGELLERAWAPRTLCGRE